jgi:hypothetical protein
MLCALPSRCQESLYDTMSFLTWLYPARAWQSGMAAAQLPGFTLKTPGAKVEGRGFSFS